MKNDEYSENKKPEKITGNQINTENNCDETVIFLKYELYISELIISFFEIIDTKG